MSGSFLMGMALPVMLRTLDEPAASVHGAIYGGYFTPYENLRTPTDAIGKVNLSISGLHDGSEVTVMANGRAPLTVSSTVGVPVFNLPYYPAGNANNVVRVFINSIGYEVIDFKYTVTGVDSTIPVFQRIDRNYKNPT